MQLKELSVPVEEADVPDYYIYIRVPMDLSTIDKVCELLLSRSATGKMIRCPGTKQIRRLDEK